MDESSIRAIVDTARSLSERRVRATSPVEASETEGARLEAVKIFVDAGLDVHQANTRGETAPHGAADRGADTIAQFLVDRGAGLNVESKQGFTPLDVALGKASFAQLPVPKPTTVSLLRQLGGLEGKDVK